ncbi:unnamed protein product [Miscanthus lutarioriparius]|uniref:Uncharacterized protein n=1 Tax=Miscanthus lutarioriparius TaxID=422564 RepID=A0A811RFU1_9POAL|nr:unnamed protein product [Miscanthus lutarioriparius]
MAETGTSRPPASGTDAGDFPELLGFCARAEALIAELLLLSDRAPPLFADRHFDPSSSTSDILLLSDGAVTYHGELCNYLNDLQVPYFLADLDIHMHAINKEYVLNNSQSLLSVIRECNFTLRWLLLHRMNNLAIEGLRRQQCGAWRQRPSGYLCKRVSPFLQIISLEEILTKDKRC